MLFHGLHAGEWNLDENFGKTQDFQENLYFLHFSALLADQIFYGSYKIEDIFITCPSEQKI